MQILNLPRVWAIQAPMQHTVKTAMNTCCIVNGFLNVF